jgi:hypothetical protein
MDRLPELSVDLIAELDTLFPDRCPDLADSEREVWAKAGERRVISFLIDLKTKQLKRRKVFPSADADHGEDDDV